MFVLLTRAECLTELNKLFNQYKFNFHRFEIEENRKMTMEKINSNTSGQAKNTLEEFAPFECMLAKNFVDLNFLTPVKAFNSFLTLMAIISLNWRRFASHAGVQLITS